MHMLYCTFHLQIMQKSLVLYSRHTYHYIMHIMFLSVNLGAKRPANGRITIFPQTSIRPKKYIKVSACPSENGAYDSFVL